MIQYPIPAEETRIEHRVQNSRFIATAAPVLDVDEAQQFISKIKSEFNNASHNVSAYIIGYGSRVISHCSDDGEPSGTAGQPALAVLAGSGLGDIAVVITRYFGGTKLGTGGLVRAYTQSVQKVIEKVPKAARVPVCILKFTLPYTYYERVKKLIQTFGGQILEQNFAEIVDLQIWLPRERSEEFQAMLNDASQGSVNPHLIEYSEKIIPL